MTKIFGPYPATCLSIHDGDTMRLEIDLGFDVLTRQNCRVYGINAPELSTQAGKDALRFAMTMVGAGTPVSVMSHGWDKYGGRFDGDVILPDGSSFAQRMLEAGHAVVLRV